MDETAEDNNEVQERSALDAKEIDETQIALNQVEIEESQTFFGKGLSDLRSLEGWKMKVAKLFVGYLLCETLTFGVYTVKHYIDVYPGIFCILAIFCLITGFLNTLIMAILSENAGDAIPLAMPLGSACFAAWVDYYEPEPELLHSYYELLYAKVLIIAGTIFLLQCVFAEGTLEDSPKSHKVRYIFNYTLFYVTLYNFFGRFLFNYFFRTLAERQMTVEHVLDHGVTDEQNPFDYLALLNNSVENRDDYSELNWLDGDIFQSSNATVPASFGSDAFHCESIGFSPVTYKTTYTYRYSPESTPFNTTAPADELMSNAFDYSAAELMPSAFDSDSAELMQSAFDSDSAELVPFNTSVSHCDSDELTSLATNAFCTDDTLLMSKGTCTNSWNATFDDDSDEDFLF